MTGSRHRFSDLTIESDRVLEELPVSTADADVSVRHWPAGPLWPRVAFAEWTMPDGSPWVSFSETPDGYCLTFTTLAQAHISRDGAHVSIQPGPDAPDDTVRHLLLNQVLPLALARRGRLVLHAAAVSWEGKVAAFLGRSGTGKSTLAAACALAGAHVVSDDCLVVRQTGVMGGWEAVPCEAGVRLWPDAIEHLGCSFEATSALAHYTRKRRIGTDASPFVFESRPLPLTQLFYLTHDVGHGGPLSGQRAVMALASELFRLDVRDVAESRAQFDAIVALARGVPLAMLSRATLETDVADVRSALWD